MEKGMEKAKEEIVVNAIKLGQSNEQIYALNDSPEEMIEEMRKKCTPQPIGVSMEIACDPVLEDHRCSTEVMHIELKRLKCGIVSKGIRIRCPVIKSRLFFKRTICTVRFM